MNAAESKLDLRSRPATGTTSAIALRRVGKLPAILYGHGSPPLAVECDLRSFDAILHAGGRNRLIDIALDGRGAETAVIREVQRDPISRRTIHADLQRVSATEQIVASIPLVPVGTAEGVKNAGGVMDVLLRELDVRGPANAIPERLEVDVTRLGINEHLSAADIVLPAGLELAVSPETIVIAVEPSRTEREAEVPAAATAAAPAPSEVPTVAETSEPAR
ncbi:MAG: 50S ribosomal protein L25 [Vulcanimicrobiaceae bacterium]